MSEGFIQELFFLFVDKKSFLGKKVNWYKEVIFFFDVSIVYLMCNVLVELL